MPASSRSLSIDEFTALVATTLGDIDVGGEVGGNSHINCVADGQELPQTPPTTHASVIRRAFPGWRRKKTKLGSTSSSRFRGSTTDSFLDLHQGSIEYVDTEFATTFLNNHLAIPSEKPLATQMATCTSEPTILASMSTVDLGNCLGLVGGACGSCSCAGTTSRNLADSVSGRNMGSNMNTNVNTTPTVPIFTLEVEGDAVSGRSGVRPIDSEPNVIDLSSTLRLPRTPSPLFRKSAPDLRIQAPPRSLSQHPESPRTPRKSFFSKLKKQLSSKTVFDSLSNPSSPTTLTPQMSVPNTTHGLSDDFAKIPFKPHLSLPPTPLSLSMSASPNPSRSPSPRFPFRAASASYKRESAPPATNVVPETPPADRSPNMSSSDREALGSGDRGKRRIHSLHNHHYASAHSDQDSSPSGPLEHDDPHTKRNSILNLVDCLAAESESPRINWMRGEPKRQKKKSFKEFTGPSSQPFPTLVQPDSDEILSDPSRYSCESAPRSVRTSLRTRNFKYSAISNTDITLLPEQAESRPKNGSLNPSTSLSANLLTPKTEEPPSYAPFVPLVFQHERLQQKLHQSVPLASFEGVSAEDACIKFVPLKPFPPRTTSLSSAASVYVRQRTKSAPNAVHMEKMSNSKHHSAIPPIPMLSIQLASVLTNIGNPPGSSSPTLATPLKNGRKVKRPTTAPDSTSPSKAQGSGAVPFPVAKETEVEPAGEVTADSRRRKPSKLKRIKLRKSPSPLRSSVSIPLARPSSPLQSADNTNVHPNLHGEGDFGSRTGSVGLDYSLSLSKHPYAQAKSSEGVSSSPEESDARAETKRTSRTSVTFVPLATEGESSRFQAQTKTERRFPVPQTLMSPSPTSPTSKSGSGSSSEASTRSPVTPRSPLHWTMGTAGITAAVKSRIGLGIAVSTPTSGSEEGQNSPGQKGCQDAGINLDSTSANVIKTNDDASRTKTEYKPPHPYSRSYSTVNPSSMEEEDTATDPMNEIMGSQFPQPRSNVDDRPSTASSINCRPSIQMYHSVVPSKPPPVGPLPSTPNAVQGSRSDRHKVDDNLLSGVPPSPVPSEYVKAFSNPSARVRDDDDSTFDPRAAPSYAPSQSSESYEQDPEYEALLAANTRANVGELASMRNIAVGRRLMSGYPQPLSSHIDPTSLKTEGKRKRVLSEAARHSGMSGEWTLFLGNDDTPPCRKDIMADLNSVPMTGIKTLSGVRARTKSESALNALGLGNNGPPGIKRARSSTLAIGSSSDPPPPVPKLVKRQIRKSEDWTLSLPLLPPDEGNPIQSTTVEEGPSGTRDPLATALIRGVKPPHYPEPEAVVCVENVRADDQFNLDDADDVTVAESQAADSPFGLDIDSLDLEDEDDSLLDFLANSAADRTPDVLPIDRLLFSVPRVVSKGSGMECATWGEDADEEAIKKKGRRLSDGLDSLLGMGGMNVRVDVNEDGESVCVVDGLTLNIEEVEDGSEEGWGIGGHESADHGASHAVQENLARLDALSADLRRFNELLKEGVGARTVMDLKHARSCGLIPCQLQKEVKTEHLKVQQSLDALRDLSASSASTKLALGISVKDRVKGWTERSANAPNVPVSSSPRPSSPPMGMKNRPSLPFAPSSPPNARPLSLSRGTALGIGPTAMSPGRSATGRTMTIATKPSHLKVVPAIGATIPDDIVGSGLKVGGNGRVISLSCSAAAAPIVANTHTGSSRTTTNEMKEKKVAAIVVQGDDDERIEGDGNDAIPVRDTKRDSTSSSFSTDSFFTSFSSPSQAPTPPPDNTASRPRQRSGSSNCSSGSDSPTPTATSPPGLRIITSSTTNSSRAHSPVDDAYSPSSSAMPTPLASSFPSVPPLPPVLSSLGENLKTVSQLLSSTWLSQNLPTKEADKSMNHKALRLSSASDVSVRTILPEQQMSEELPVDTSLPLEAERDTESMYSDSFYSARSSFEA